MGWKTLRDTFNIEHIVQVAPNGNIVIGSSYIQDLITIDPAKTLTHEVTHRDITSNEDLRRYLREFKDNREKLHHAVHATDTFERNIPVYFPEIGPDGRVKRYFCENLGWPNVTHCGKLMYENTFFCAEIDAAKELFSELARQVQFNRKHINNQLYEITRRTECIESATQEALQLMNHYGGVIEVTFFNDVNTDVQESLGYI